jgi:hypothetical protein
MAAREPAVQVKAAQFGNYADNFTGPAAAYLDHDREAAAIFDSIVFPRAHVDPKPPPNQPTPPVRPGCRAIRSPGRCCPARGCSPGVREHAGLNATIALCAHCTPTMQLRNLSGGIPERGEYFDAMLTQEWGALCRRARRPGELHRSSHDCERFRDAGMFHLDDHVSGRDVLIMKKVGCVVYGTDRHMSAKDVKDLCDSSASGPLGQKISNILRVPHSRGVGGVTLVGAQLGSTDQPAQQIPLMVARSRDRHETVRCGEHVERAELRIAVALWFRHYTDVRMLIDDPFTQRNDRVVHRHVDELAFASPLRMP